jgi:hypothetical protein
MNRFNFTLSARVIGVCLFACVACGGGSDGPVAAANSNPDSVSTVIGAAGGTAVTPSGAAGVRVPAGIFAQPVTLTIRQLANSAVPGQGPLATTLKQYPPYYEFSTSPSIQQFADSVLVGLCQVTDPASPFYAPENTHSRLRIAHSVGASTEILAPADASQFLRCTNVSASTAHPSRSLLGAVARVLTQMSARLRPRQLYAAHGGLGGKTKSFSPFAAVDPGPNQIQLHVEAFIDGRSQLILKGNTAQWHHIEAAAPGRWFDHNDSTIINASTWFPTWPDVPTKENRDCNCFSSLFAGVSPPLPASAVTIDVSLIDSPGSTQVVQTPAASNNYTLIIDFNDPGAGQHWYRLNIFATPP